uniref:PC105R n=1 Tax=African swine fever virus TaxID=10497 RepID=A0A6G7KU90_ASF
MANLYGLQFLYGQNLCRWQHYFSLQLRRKRSRGQSELARLYQGVPHRGNGRYVQDFYYKCTLCPHELPNTKGLPKLSFTLSVTNLHWKPKNHYIGVSLWLYEQQRINHIIPPNYDIPLKPSA